MLPTDLDSSFGELRLTGQTFARRDAGVVSFLEFSFEFSQLARAESRAIPAEFPLLLVVVVSSSSVRVLLLQQLRLRRVVRCGEGGAPDGKVSGRRRRRHAVRPHRRIFRTGVGRVLTQRTATTAAAAAETAAAAFAGAPTAAMTAIGRIYWIQFNLKWIRHCILLL